MKQLIIVFFLVFSLLSSFVYGQSFNASEIVTVDDQQFILHKVEKGETIFSLCQQYNVEQKELVAANPQLIFGLKEGDTIKIPYYGEEEKEVEDEVNVHQFDRDGADLKYHVVARGETVYSLAREYNISIEAFYRFNPEAKKELLENEIVRIPLDAEEEESSGLIREDADYFYHQVRAGETLYSLSQKYDKKMSLIMETNSLSDQQLEVGVVLRIPKKEEEDEEKAPMVDGDGEYFLHRVESGDTFYSYKRRFGVTKEQLLQLNPELNDGLLAGLTIKIPSKEIPQVKVKPRDADKFIDHKVKPGETFYSLSRKFDIGIMAIKSLNPELKNRGLKAGEIIYIPNIKEKYELADTLKSEDAKPLTLTEETDIELPEAYFEVEEDTFEVYTDKFNILEDDTFRISMFLPLFYDKNDTFNLELRDEEEMAKLDSLKDVDPEILEAYFEIRYDEESLQADTIMTDSLVAKSQKSLMPHTKYFMNFYQGFLLGLDSMYNAGVKIRLDLYDSQYDREVVDSLLLSKDFINADLIVGPVDVSLQKHISEFSNKNQIPMVSPFSSNSLFLEENPFYYQVSPSKDYVLRKTSDFIGDAFYDKNFIVMTLGEIEQLSESNLVDLVREKFFTSGVYNNVGEVLFTQVDFTEGGHLGYWQVKKTLKPDMENVIFIPASENRDVREALLSRAINSLYVLSEEFDITLVGVSDYPNFRSINTEYFHKLKLHYLTPRYVDYTSPLVNEFIAGYRGHFYDEPDEYSFRGYDIALFFTGAYAYLGNNFSDKISAYRTRLTQSDFNFQRVSEMSGYMNHTLYIMNYTKGYDVNMLYKITEGRMIVNE